MVGFNGLTRTEERIRNNLGIIPGNDLQQMTRYRDMKLHKYDLYLENKQYDKLRAWDYVGQDSEHIPIRQRKPRIIYNLGKRIVDTVTSKLVGRDRFPKISVDGDDATNEFIDILTSEIHFRHKMIPAVKRMLSTGSSFVRFQLIDGRILKIETFNSKYCYPQFSEDGELDSVEIRYVYEDRTEKDRRGNYKEKWYRLVLTRTTDYLFNNPEYKGDGEAANFEVKNQVDHNLGYVQGAWFRTGEDRHNPDGPSLICDSFDFLDSINYSLSQSDQAITYGQEPQLGISGMDTDELDKLIKSSSKAWNLGRDGVANFIEANLDGVSKADELRVKFFQGIQHVARVVMLDPEKIVGSAQSAKAMEVLHGPLLDLVDELRPQVEMGMTKLLTKIMVTLLRSEQQVITIPPGYQPQSLNLEVKWPPVFPHTMLDLQQKVQVAVAASNASLVSRETLTRWLAKDFQIENVEEEIAKVAAQPVLNPFGAF